jgi:hypothetical protein
VRHIFSIFTFSLVGFALAFSQGFGGKAGIGGKAGVGGGSSAGSVNTFTLIQAPAASSCTISGGTCTFTPTSTIGTNHGLLLSYGQTAAGSADYTTAVSGGCSVSWVFPATAKTFSGSDGSENWAYCLSSSSATSLTVSAPISGVLRLFEVSCSTGTCNFDQCQANTNTSGTPQSGQTLATLHTSSEEIVQAWNSGSQRATSVASPFGHFDNSSGIGEMSTADNENTASGSATNIWTLGSAATGMTSACALY